MCPDSFWIYARSEIHAFSGQHVQGCHPHHSKWCSDAPVFQFVPINSVLSLGTAGSVFFALSIQVFAHSVRFPLSLTFSRLNPPSCLNLFLQQRCSSPLNILGALPWTLFGMSMSLLYWGTWNWVQHSRNSLTSAKYSTTLDLLAVLCLRSPGYRLPLCESAQAGTNIKISTKCTEYIYFSYSISWESSKQHPGTQAELQAL